MLGFSKPSVLIVRGETTPTENVGFASEFGKFMAEIYKDKPETTGDGFAHGFARFIAEIEESGREQRFQEALNGLVERQAVLRQHMIEREVTTSLRNELEERRREIFGILS